MYDYNEGKISWSKILKNILKFILVILIIFGIFTLVRNCSNDRKNKEKNNKVEPEKVVLRAQLDKVQEATLKFLNKDNLPTEINSAKTIKLKYLVNKNLIEPVKDSSGTTCDNDSSYSEVRRLEDNYAVTISLTCGTNKEDRVIYIGCFQGDELSIGSADSKGGICNATSKDKEKNNNSNNENNSNNQPSNNPNNTTDDSSITLYEQQKCDKNYTCERGTLNGNNNCVYRITSNPIPNVLTQSGILTMAPRRNVTTETSISRIAAKPIVTKQYSNGKVVGSVTTYTCSDTTYNYNPVSGYCEKTITVGSAVTYDCTDSSYKYNATTGLCEKNGVVGSTTTYGCSDNSYHYDPSAGLCVKDVVASSKEEKTCQTIWSQERNLSGWTFTGNTKKQAQK